MTTTSRSPFTSCASSASRQAEISAAELYVTTRALTRSSSPTTAPLSDRPARIDCGGDIGAVLGLLRRRAAAVLLCLLAGLGGGYAVLHESPNVYQSQSKVFVSLPGTTTPAEALQGLQISSQLLQSYAEIVTSRTLAQKVKDRLSLPETPDAIRGKLSAAPQPQTLYIVIKGSDNDPIRARSITEAATGVLIDSIRDLEKGRDRATAVQASVRDPPVRGKKISPRPTLDLLVGGLIGLLVGLTLALALDA